MYKDEAAQQEKVLTKLKESDAEGADIRNAVSRGASEEKLQLTWVVALIPCVLTPYPALSTPPILLRYCLSHRADRRSRNEC